MIFSIPNFSSIWDSKQITTAHMMSYTCCSRSSRSGLPSSVATSPNCELVRGSTWFVNSGEPHTHPTRSWFGGSASVMRMGRSVDVWGQWGHTCHFPYSFNKEEARDHHEKDKNEGFSSESHSHHRRIPFSY